MEIGSAREEIGAGQPSERKLGPVRTTAYRCYDRGYTDRFHSIFCQIHYVHMTVLDDIEHVVVHVMFFDDHRIITVRFIEETGHIAEILLPVFEAFPVVVADEHVDGALFDSAAYFIDVEEAVPAFRIFRFFSCRKHLLPFRGKGNGIDHFPFGVPV